MAANMIKQESGARRLLPAVGQIVVVIVVGLTYFPVVALGPVVEHLVGHFPL